MEQPRASTRSRQSIYPVPPPVSYWERLAASSNQLRLVSASLERSIITLEQGTDDLPRLSKLIASNRCYDVVPQSEIRLAERELVSDISPQVNDLISRAEVGLEKLKKREKMLIDKTILRAKPRTLVPSYLPPTVVSTTSPVSNQAIAVLERKAKTLAMRKSNLMKATDKLDSELERLKEQLKESQKS